MDCCNREPIGTPYCVPYAGFTEFVASIPKLYWGVKSQEQRILAICEQLNKLICFVDYQGGKINLNRQDIDWLMEQFEAFKEHGFDDYYLTQVEQWIDDKMSLIASIALNRLLFFGLTLDGYFVAYIPDSWNDIEFDTGANYANNDYGRLILKYLVDSPHPAEQ